MTGIHDLPEEVLSCIFEYLEPGELIDTQYVCRSWYLPAHKALLQLIILEEPSNLMKFMNSIDANPDPAYLNSVKTIALRNDVFDYPNRFPLAGEIVDKMILRFPNLVRFELGETWITYEDMNDEVCQQILDTCPRLGTFRLHPLYGSSRYNGSFLKLRLLLSSIDLDKARPSRHSNNTAQFLSQFPRLKSIKSLEDHLDCFAKMLPAVIHLPLLKSICILRIREDQYNFAQHFLATLTTQEQQRFTDILSRVTELEVAFNGAFGVNSMQFAVQYFKHLETFIMRCNENDNWTDAQYELFRDHLLDMALNATRDGRLYFNYMKSNDLARYFPMIAEKVFPTTCRNRVLRLIFSDAYVAQDLINFTIESKPRRPLREIDLAVANEHSLDEVGSSFFDKIAVPINHVNTFILSYHARDRQAVETHINMLDAILGKMPLVKKLVLQIPASFKVESGQDYGYRFPIVKTLTVQTITGVNTPALLDACAVKFPNVKRLNIDYFCGTYVDDGYQLDLSHYTLDRLTLDITPVKRRLNKEMPQPDDFLIIEIIEENHEQQLYKVGLRPLLTERITENDLVDNENYTRMRLSVGSLKRLDIELFYYGGSEETYMFFHEDVYHLKVFDNSEL